MKRDWNFKSGREISEKFPSIGVLGGGGDVFWKNTLKLKAARGLQSQPAHLARIFKAAWIE